MNDTKRPLLLLTQVVFWLLFTATVFGQPAPPKPLSELDFTALLHSRMKQVDDLGDLDDAAKKKVKDLYQQALGEMEAAKRWAKEAARWEELATQAPKELNQTRIDLAAFQVLPPPVVPKDLSEPMISKREAELTQWRTELTNVEAELKSRATSSVEIPQKISAARQRLADLGNQLQISAAAGDGSQEITANRMILVAKRRTVEQEILSYERKLAAYEARTELLPQRRDLITQQVALAEQQIKQWRQSVNRRRQQEAEQQVDRAKWEASQAHPEVQELVETNAKLAEMRKALAAEIVATTNQLEKVKQTLKTVREVYTGIQEKVKIVGLTNGIGQILRRKKCELPNLGEYRDNAAIRQQTMSKCAEERLQLDDSRKPLANLNSHAQTVMEKLNVSPEAGNRVELEVRIRDALEKKKTYLDNLILDCDTYYDKLGNLYTAELELIKETENCNQFIDERVLWIASAVPFVPEDLHNAADALWWLAGPDACLDIGRTLAADAKQYKTLSGMALVIFVLLLYWRMRFRSRLQEIGEKASRGSCYHFLPTVEATLLTALIAVVWPGLLGYLGWRLSNAASPLCMALGMGLIETAKVFFALELLRYTCCPLGLAEAHFGWSAAALKRLRQNIRWLIWPILPLMCAAVAMAWQEIADRWDTSLGRMCFVAALLCFTLALHRILRPGSVVFQAMIAARRGGWLERFRYVWYPLCLLTPAMLAVLAAVGYHYTARQLTIRLILTTYVLVGGAVCRALLMRWALVNQRRLAIEQARQRRAAMQNENNADEEPSGAELPMSNASERDLATINTQTRRFIEYSLVVAAALALWCAWIDVLPALGSMNVKLGETTVTVLERNHDPDGTEHWKWTDRLRDITLAHLFLAAIILATTAIAAKNIPGLLEMAVLQHLPFDAGARYAVATVCRYVITLVGLLLGCGVMGIGWSKVQWLVAAMSLGLGFGLQEIFANFVSGLIILFERPVRVGDVVTIDGVTGVVSRIRMRATTITDGDRKELIIPNKEFITGRVLNWTLTDPVNRVVIPVGVAYGSDTEKVAAILMKVAENHPNVLDDPAPGISLESFGDSALNFVLRCFLPNMDSRGTVIHELHMAIDREFRASGIEIAFPQQDVHVRSIDLPLAAIQPSLAGGSAAWPKSVEKAA